VNNHPPSVSTGSDVERAIDCGTKIEVFSFRAAVLAGSPFSPTSDYTKESTTAPNGKEGRCPHRDVRELYRWRLVPYRTIGDVYRGGDIPEVGKAYALLESTVIRPTRKRRYGGGYSVRRVLSPHPFIIKCRDRRGRFANTKTSFAEGGSWFHTAFPSA
jgi:hypothetical protein